MIRILCILLLGFSLTACYEKEEGCLNRKASNFDIGADKNCADCCTFPKLKIRFNNKWQFPDTLAAFSKDSIFHDHLNQAFRINNIRFYWSNFQLNINGGQQITVTDLMDVKIPNGTDTMMLNVVDDYLLTTISGSTSSYTLGTIAPEGVLTGLSVNFGIEQPVNSAFADAMPDGHALSPQLGNLNYDTDIGYVFAQIEYFQDTIAIDTTPVVINIYGDAALRAISLPLADPIQLIEGFNPQFVIETNFAQWFDGVNVRLGDTTVIQSLIVDNIAESFTLKEVIVN